mmetsp:Transcript_34060/g.75515  ORF Transcript_34060/g.75515 Transcript_34060/m.75515 type:complete len:227 (-) Transcript_34060:123-803(-)|eukprot:CAMPEP_0202900634 /NCGR_PEP_ID=MMETSP1392-20130828/11954_1 /ASSEMBLY_ACC=CAM_ASM_000868 /TAXON_ID=225041 /ORGANISM="Chlamydomonas chlamydogama, Strain SAG 11-48b" /LENGTH=226 /DNA_ID=CAMNT_0049587069 /DNA_START=209 /DNA_END=889 /DNA_ORIENTATION=+
MSNDASALFRQYENEYCSKSTDISRKIQALPSYSGENRRTKTTEVEGLLKSADAVIKSMEMEARSLPAATSQPLITKVKEYKADLANLKESLKKSASAAPIGDAARAELGLGGDYYSTSAAQRDRMLSATQRMEKTTQNLEWAKNQLDVTQDLGAQILQDLHGQRETILRASNTLKGADDNITKSRKILSNMARRIWQNKIIMFGIIAFLVFAIGIILYVKLRPSN